MSKLLSLNYLRELQIVCLGEIQARENTKSWMKGTGNRASISVISTRSLLAVNFGNQMEWLFKLFLRYSEWDGTHL